MSLEALETLVAQLRAESELLGEDGSANRERLESLAAELEHRLRDPREDNQDEVLVEKLQTAVGIYEIEHPRTTALLNQVLVHLGSLGI